MAGRDKCYQIRAFHNKKENPIRSSNKAWFGENFGLRIAEFILSENFYYLQCAILSHYRGQAEIFPNLLQKNTIQNVSTRQLDTVDSSQRQMWSQFC
jgi:hypothetical protein